MPGSYVPAGNPDLLDLMHDTPLARVRAPLPLEHPGFWAKLECTSAGGMKARAAVSMLLGARDRGELRPGHPVVESTSGTLGIGLAFAGQALGHPIVLVVDRELEPGMRALLKAHGARLEVVDRPHPTGGWQQARLDRVRELRRELPDSYWPDQYNNPDNPAGYEVLGEELVRQVDDVDVLVCSVGSGGHSAGAIRAVRRRWPRSRMIGVDTIGSTIFGQPSRPRIMRGLGSSIHPRNVAYREFDEVHWVGPAEAAQACRRLAARAFITGGWSTGAVAVVAAWAARVEPEARVVTVFPDGPHRYLGTIFDDDYCRERGLLEQPVAGRPMEIAHSGAVAVDGWTRCRVVADPLAAMEVPA
ncbi:PLP-dependent cysteine synthase family protein [Parasphingorhabdus pacifica]